LYLADTVPGDQFFGEMAIVKAKYATAQLVDVAQASDDRVRPKCIGRRQMWGGCPGGNMSAIVSESSHLKRDQEWISGALQRIRWIWG
jgi:tRNA/tmRNA/rRNA uracil-C5-methylase (TrmA/RlmC/RlmD family)